MIKYMPISEARKKITSLDKEISYDDTISITNHGKEVYALLRWDTYESIAETLDILSDEALYNDLKKGIQQFERGELVDFDTLKQSLDVHD
ncbi:MAG TPA: type II toxin-antitoxin system Phd/YefM family antitoxin [Spirochaetales bacterium]|nr:type II toxin-antitoxin system Phd/YefM family antitoxin [Spirochaetales bacterium]